MRITAEHYESRNGAGMHWGFFQGRSHPCCERTELGASVRPYPRQNSRIAERPLIKFSTDLGWRVSEQPNTIRALVVHTAEHGMTHIAHCKSLVTSQATLACQLIIIIIIIIFINCNWVVTRWQWLFYMYTKYEIGYY